MKSSLVVAGTAFHTPNPAELEVLENCAIAVGEEGEILSVERQGTDAYDQVVSKGKAEGHLVTLADDEFLIPGLVDLHVHAPQWPQLGKALDEPLEVWLQKYTFPLEAKYSDSEFAYRVYDDMVQSLLAHGTTTAMYFGTVDLKANVILAEACIRHGQRALVGKVAMDNPDQCPEDYRDASWEAAVADTRRFIEQVGELAQPVPNLVQPVITPRFIPSCTDELLKALGELAQQTGCHVQTHCSESDWEVQYVRDRLGKTDVEALRDFGLLRDNSVLAHSNFVTDDDLHLMCQHGAAVAHCPLSNAYFANAVFPTRRALDSNVEIGLGTDISAGFSPSMFDAARHALVASHNLGRGVDPHVSAENRGSGEMPLSTIETFFLATAGGGQSLSLPIGMFRPGYQFDALSVRANLRHSGFRFDARQDNLEHVHEKLVLTADRGCLSNIWVGGRRYK